RVLREVVALFELLDRLGQLLLLVQLLAVLERLLRLLDLRGRRCRIVGKCGRWHHDEQCSESNKSDDGPVHVASSASEPTPASAKVFIVGAGAMQRQISIV